MASREHFSGEQGNKGLKWREQEHKKAILGNIDNQDFDIGEQGNKANYCWGTREQVLPMWGHQSSSSQFSISSLLIKKEASLQTKTIQSFVYGWSLFSWPVAYNNYVNLEYYLDFSINMCLWKEGILNGHCEQMVFPDMSFS